MTRRALRRFMHACLASVITLGWPLSASAEDTLTWLLRDLPPLTIFEGPQKDHGALDHLIPMLEAQLPEYHHQVLHVNRARGMQMLRNPSLTCDPSVLWTQERAAYVAFSEQAFVVLSNGVMIRRSEREAMAPFIVDGKFDLQAFLQTPDARLGAIAERSYGPAIDERLKQTDPHKLALHYGNDALGSLLQMQRLGRLEAVLGYWTEIRYQATRQGIAPDDLMFLAIKGAAPYQRIYIGCSDTVEGRRAIARINQALEGLPQADVQNAYALWLDPHMRERYLKDNPHFFQVSPLP
ncbi:hypothetical protein CYL20_13715 [Pseudomonas palleroniana]|uniref:TIGR02285 family protein n=1 Tax=Pseudomonas palleroniana TaxID=191390 RepID=A0A2L1JAV0_9PSED|nr:TIGR02285 family protein [Pseudomonas palleroniana]AVE05551.1 hypothetical protein CYL20_13715 [Pseudomonas palleroniana]